MIRKKDKNLINWIHRHIIDFEDENDKSGLTWESSHQDALEFMHSMPVKERVQRYGYYSTNGYFFLVEDFDDIGYCLKKGLISEPTCKNIYKWNSEVGRENWNMADVENVLYPKGRKYDKSTQNFLVNTLDLFIEMGVMECINPEVKKGRLYKLTEKGERILEEV